MKHFLLLLLFIISACCRFTDVEMSWNSIVGLSNRLHKRICHAFAWQKEFNIAPTHHPTTCIQSCLQQTRKWSENEKERKKEMFRIGWCAESAVTAARWIATQTEWWFYYFILISWQRFSLACVFACECMHNSFLLE